MTQTPNSYHKSKILSLGQYFELTLSVIGCGCGSVGRAVAYDTRDLRFKCRHRQNFIYRLYNRKDENKEKEAGIGPSFKKTL